MVKNQKGGSKSKKMGRKFVNSNVQKQIRLADPNEPCEIYGVVEKLFGHGRFQIKDINGKERLVIIPNKFRGRGKRDNTVTLGGWVLVGIREYESAENPKCDLLEVYSDAEKNKLKNSGDSKFNNLKSDHDRNNIETTEDDLFTFSNGTNEIYEEMVENTNIETIEDNKDIVQFDDDGEIDIDDI